MHEKGIKPSMKVALEYSKKNTQDRLYKNIMNKNVYKFIMYYSQDDINVEYNNSNRNNKMYGNTEVIKRVVHEPSILFMKENHRDTSTENKIKSNTSVVYSNTIGISTFFSRFFSFFTLLYSSFTTFVSSIPLYLLLLLDFTF